VEVGIKVAVKGRAVSVSGSVGYGVMVSAGIEVGSDVRVEAIIGTHRTSPG
jgi:hypothetical protein